MDEDSGLTHAAATPVTARVEGWGERHKNGTVILAFSHPAFPVMHLLTLRLLSALVPLLTAQGCVPDRATGAALADQDTIYTTRRTPDPDGTGRFYMGREIAPVVSHQSVGWLERTEREEEERTDLLLNNLGLEPADVVADIGAGSGHFSFRLASLVPRGSVLAVDIQPEMISILRDSADAKSIQNVQPVLGEIDDPKIAAGAVDLVLLVDAYHEFSHPFEMMTNIYRALKKGGRVALVEYRGEDPTVPIKPRHKMTEAQAKREMSRVGLTWVETRTVLPQQHLMFFRK